MGLQIYFYTNKAFSFHYEYKFVILECDAGALIWTKLG